MNKRQYTFLWLMIILLYLSFKIIHFEYNKYIISKYISNQMLVIKEIQDYLKSGNKTIKYIETNAFKNKVLKESWKQMKWENVIVLTSQKKYIKFSWKEINIYKKTPKEIIQTNITKWMTNSQKWIYFLLNKDIR